MKISSRTQQEEKRLSALSEFQLMDTPPEEAFERLTALAARLFNVPIVLITLVGRDKQFFKSHFGLSICETTRDISFCSHAIEQDNLLVIPDTLADPRFAINPLVLGYPFIRFYAGKPLITADGDRLGTICIIDIIPRKALNSAEQQNLSDLAALVMDRMALHRLEVIRHSGQQQFESIAATSPDAIICSNVDNGITFWNEAAKKMFGYSSEEILGTMAGRIICLKDLHIYEEELNKLRQGVGSTLEGKVFQLGGLRKNGEEFPAEVSLSVWRAGYQTQAGIIVRDVTERYESEARLFRLASLDMLTGLSNRAAYYRIISEFKTQALPFTLLLLDLDGFKAINDTNGHAVGDVVLCRVAAVLEETFKDASVIARLGGDEFVLLLSGELDNSVLGQRMTSFIKNLGQPFIHDGVPLEIKISIGMAQYPRHGSDEQQVMKAADLALYRAKANGKGRYEVFISEFLEVDHAQKLFAGELNQALIRNELVLYYQPKFFTETLQIAGFEVLLRWNHPVRGLIKPSAFMHALNSTSLTNDVGHWVLETALQQMLQWHQHYPLLKCSINLFNSQLQSDSTDVPSWKVLADVAQFPFMEFEIDENFLIGSSLSVQQKIIALSDMGASVVIDHFGKNTAALTLLCQKYLSALKIDKKLIHQIGINPQVDKLVGAIVIAGKKLGLITLANGVETQVHLNCLIEAGCQIVQGDFLSQPLSSMQVERLMMSYHITNS